MFNIGFGELAIICIVLIIAVGPERLPSMMKTLGKTIRTLRQASRDIRASTGIDELLREDFDLYSPPSPPRRPALVPPTPAPEAPAPVSRQDPLELPATAVTSADPARAEPAAPSPPEPATSTVSAALLGGAEPQPAIISAEPAPMPPAPPEAAPPSADQPVPLPAEPKPADPAALAAPGAGRVDQPKQPGS